MRRRRHREEAIAIPVASMGDIAFLLIIFFMVCGSFFKQTPIEPPRVVRLDALKETAISITIDKENVVWFQGKPGYSAELIQAEVSRLLQDVDPKDDDARTVIFRCDKSVNRDVFEPVLSAIAEAGGIIAAVGEQIKK